MRFAALLVLLCFATVTAALGQQSQLVAKGQVVSPVGQPVPGVPVVVKGPQGDSVAVTDTRGQWFLYNLPAGEYEVKAMGTDASKTFTVESTTTIGKIFRQAPTVSEVPKIVLNPK